MIEQAICEHKHKYIYIYIYVLSLLYVFAFVFDIFVTFPSPIMDSPRVRWRLPPLCGMYKQQLRQNHNLNQIHIRYILV